MAVLFCLAQLSGAPLNALQSLVPLLKQQAVKALRNDLSWRPMSQFGRSARVLRPEKRACITTSQHKMKV